MSCASVRPVLCSSRSVRCSCRADLGVHKESVRHWVWQAEADTGPRRRDLLSSKERDERRFPSYEHLEHETLSWIGCYYDEGLPEELGENPTGRVRG